MKLEDQNFVECTIAEKDEHIFECHKMIRQLKKAYHFARNSAAGLTNYCEESASTIRCEKELEQAELIYNQSLEPTQETSDSAK